MAVEWCKKHPERLRAELTALKKIEPRFKLDIVDLKRGLVTIKGTVIIDGKETEVYIKYPDLYPYFRCEIFAPSLDLHHHQNPFEKNLCLLKRSTAEWHINDTAASLILEQLPIVLKTGNSIDIEKVAEMEEIQGEPITNYLSPNMNGPCVLFDSGWKIEPNVDKGMLTFGLNPQGNKFQWAVKEIRDNHGRLIAEASERIKKLYSENSKGKWVRYRGRIKTADPAELFRIVTETFPRSLNEPGIYGILIEEETAWRKASDGWIFLWILSKSQIQYFAKILGLDNKKVLQRPLLIRALRAGQVDIQARTPELGGLHEKHVLVIGLGCLGAPSAIEFARNGIGELRLWDCDFVEPGTITRWPLGLPVAGLPKTECLRNFITEHYPFCNVQTLPPMRLGGIRHFDLNRNEDDSKLVNTAIEKVDLIYDATAEVGVQRFLSDIAYDKSIPYIKISASPGIWGGEAARIVPIDSKGCWLCLYQAQRDGDLPSPIEAPDGTIYPAGCGARTFTGTSFDSGIISMTGVRLAVATLLRGSGGYPDFDWDVAIINLRDENGKPVPPYFQAYPLHVHKRCPSGRH